MPTVAKLVLSSVEDYGTSRKFKFNCVHDSGLNIGNSPENKSFTKATPNGEAWLTVDNQNVWPQFTLNDDPSVYKPSHYYVVFVDANANSIEDVQMLASALK